MTNSDCYELDYAVENLAIGYSYDWQSPYRWRNNIFRHVIKGGPAGGGYSTVQDLHRFALALLGYKLVKKPMLDLLWTDFKGGAYGYGFQVRQGPEGKVIGHSGVIDGLNSNLDIYQDSGFIVVVMSNHDGGASPLAAKIGRILARVKAQYESIGRRERQRNAVSSGFIAQLRGKRTQHLNNGSTHRT